MEFARDEKCYSMSGLKAALKNPFPRTSRGFIFLLVLIFGFLWFALINHLRVEWTLNPQYGYGWAVPFLCLYLIWQKIQQHKMKGQGTGNKNLFFAFALLALFYAPTRLVEEANPEWRLVSWALALEVVGLTLLMIYFALGIEWLKRLAFPVAYFLVAVPWPSFLETHLIQGLTRADAVATVELLGWLGIPAIPHGNVIEVATGEVGIDEACSGIRSFQATLMISLFLGEFYRLNFSRRMILVLGGFAMSFLFNLARMSILVWIAAHQGIAAITKWHDPMGMTILLACFCGLWGLGIFLARQKILKLLRAEVDSENKFKNPTCSLLPLLISFGIWIFAVEVSVEFWYCSHEARLPVAQQWSISWPTNNPTFKELPLADATRQILRYNEGRSAAWTENDLDWQAIFLRWNPGRTAVHLAQNHTPEICMTGAGHTLTTISEREWFDVRGLHLPFLVCEVTDVPHPFFVFYCLWDDRASAQGLGTMSLDFGNRLAPVLAGLRNPGQRSLEIAVSGVADVGDAENALREQLEKLVLVNKQHSDTLPEIPLKSD
jgi:exosortase